MPSHRHFPLFRERESHNPQKSKFKESRHAHRLLKYGCNLTRQSSGAAIAGFLTGVCRDLVYDCLVQVDLTDKERDILIRRKKRSDAHKLVRMKVEAGLSMPQQMRVTVGSKRFYDKNGKIARQRSSTAERPPFQVGPTSRSSINGSLCSAHAIDPCRGLASCQVPSKTPSPMAHYAQCPGKIAFYSAENHSARRSASPTSRLSQPPKKSSNSNELCRLTNRLSETRTAWKQDHPSLPDLALELERVLERPTTTSTKKLRTW